MHGQLEYLVCLVPRRTIICERVLEEEGVYEDVILADYHLVAVPHLRPLLASPALLSHAVAQQCARAGADARTEMRKHTDVQLDERRCRACVCC